ncbi:MAG: isoamylase early set domain-containing protein [Spirosomataceae bacterium]
MALAKEFSTANPVCKVTFTVSKDAVNGAKEVALLGEFNGWNPATNLLKKQKNGTYTTSIELEAGKEYAFRYLADGQYWFNDDAADKYIPSGVSYEENSVVVLQGVEIKKEALKKVAKTTKKAEVAVEAKPAKATKVEAKAPAKATTKKTAKK